MGNKFVKEQKDESNINKAFLQTITQSQGNIVNYLNKDNIICDTAGKYYINKGNGEGAGGASGALYRGISGKPSRFYFDKSVDIKLGQASRVCEYITTYGTPVYLIHVIGPDFRQKGHTDDLVNTYHNMMKSYVKYEDYNKSLILLGISTGIFSGNGKFNANKYYETANAVYTAYTLLTNEEREFIHKSSIEFVEFNYENHKKFEKAFMNYRAK